MNLQPYLAFLRPGPSSAKGPGATASSILFTGQRPPEDGRRARSQKQRAVPDGAAGGADTRPTGPIRLI